MNISSVFYPAWVPFSLRHELVITTKPGNNVLFKLDPVATPANLTSENSSECEDTFLQVLDGSLSKSGTVMKQYTCKTNTNVDDSSTLATTSFTTFLNTLKVVVSTGFHGNAPFMFSFYGKIAAVEGKLLLKRNTIS